MAAAAAVFDPALVEAAEGESKGRLSSSQLDEPDMVAGVPLGGCGCGCGCSCGLWCCLFWRRQPGLQVYTLQPLILKTDEV